MIILFYILAVQSLFARDGFMHCSKKAQNFQNVQKLLKSKRYLEGRKLLVQTLSKEGDNFGMIKTKSGIKKTIYRSGFLTYNPKCIEELAIQGNVSLVINVSNINGVGTEDSRLDINNILTNSEKDQFSFFGVENYLKYQYKEENQEGISALLKYIKHYNGNILIHCWSGFHRSGMLIGLIQKCINREKMENIILEYKKYTQYKTDKDIGEYRESNVQYIKNFDCNDI